MEGIGLNQAFGIVGNVEEALEPVLIVDETGCCRRSALGNMRACNTLIPFIQRDMNLVGAAVVTAQHFNRGQRELGRIVMGNFNKKTRRDIHKENENREDVMFGAIHEMA